MTRSMTSRVIVVALWLCAMGCVVQPRARRPSAASAADDRLAAVLTAEVARCPRDDCERACEQRDGAACALIGEHYADGSYGHSIDAALAFRYASRGCDAGDGRSCRLRARLYLEGRGVPWSPGRAVEVLEQACTAGSGDSCLDLYAIYHRGHGVDGDVSKASSYRARGEQALEAGCRDGRPVDCASLSVALRANRSHVVPPEARRLAERACDGDVFIGCLDVFNDRVVAGVGIDLDSLTWWCEVAHLGACGGLADAYRKWAESSHDPARLARALDLNRRACRAGARDGCVTAGDQLVNGIGAAVDLAAARTLFLRACDLGSGAGCLRLAQDAAVATGHEAEAARFAELACQRAAYDGCDIVLHGLEHRDPEAADRWALEGCRLGSWFGCRRLAERERALPPIPLGVLKRMYTQVCTTHPGAACRRVAEIERDERVATGALQAAIAQRDVAGFAKLVTREFSVANLWFDVPACADKFGWLRTTEALARAEYPALLGCLSALDVRLEPRPRGDPALVYGPGVQLIVERDDGLVKQIAAAGPSPLARPTVPTPIVRMDVLAAHLVAGPRDLEPAPAVRDAIAGSKDHVASVDLWMCVSATGKVAAVRELGHVGPASYALAVEQAVGEWRFSPIEWRGKPIAVCSYVSSRYPTADEPPPPPPPPPGSPPGVSGARLETNRTAGVREIVPDAAMRAGLEVVHKDRVASTFKLCVDVRGGISKVSTLLSTGSPAYDRKITSEIWAWRFRPFFIDGVVQPVCAAVTFITDLKPS